MIHLCFHSCELTLKYSHVLERFGGLIKFLELVLVAGIYFGQSIFEILLQGAHHSIEIDLFLLLFLLYFF